jgi:hypothetical protein
MSPKRAIPVAEPTDTFWSVLILRMECMSNIAPRGSSERWPWFAVAAAVLAFPILMLIMGAEVFDEGSIRVAEELSEIRGLLVLGQFMGFAATACLLGFAVGYYRFLQERLPAGSMSGQVAGAALIASVGALIVAYGLLATLADALPGDRLLLFGGETDSTRVLEQAYPAEVKSTIYWIASNAICFGWLGVIPAAVATASAALRHRILPRWIGWFSVVVAAIGSLMVAIGLPFGAVFYGPIWLGVMGVGLFFHLREKSVASEVAPVPLPA